MPVAYGDNMGSSQIFPFPDGTATVLGYEELRRYDAWRSAFSSRGKDHRYYEIIEHTLDNGFEHCYLLLRDSTGVIRGIQPLFFVRQNLVEGVPLSVRKAVDSIRRKFPKFLTLRVLMVGCAAGEGHLGAIDSNESGWVANALHHCLPMVAREAGASLVVLKDFSSTYRTALSVFSRNGFERVPSMPMTRLSLQFSSFEDYLSHLSYATRKSLRRKFRKAERAKIQLEIVDDITLHLDEIYPLYLAVHERSAMKFEKLTKEYLSQLGRVMPDRVKFFIWRLEGRIVAFSVCIVHEGIIYDEYLGLDYSVALDLHLYFRTFRDILTWAIRHRLTTYCSSPLNYDPKLHLGCDLAPLDLYVMHTTPLLNRFFRHAVRLLEPTRHDPVLLRFRNAAELR
ncbi:MAG TPA: GNAT family N-acetyltransferase [Chthoniobacterales bacterium]|jgi:predicted N-acyltransferase